MNFLERILLLLHLHFQVDPQKCDRSYKFFKKILLAGNRGVGFLENFNRLCLVVRKLMIRRRFDLCTSPLQKSSREMSRRNIQSRCYRKISYAICLKSLYLRFWYRVRSCVFRVDCHYAPKIFSKMQSQFFGKIFLSPPVNLALLSRRKYLLCLWK